MNYRLSQHAAVEMARRGLSEAQIDDVLRDPGQIVRERDGRCCYQSVVTFGDGRFLLRVIVVEGTDPLQVVTAYRTSRVSKYWRAS